MKLFSHFVICIFLTLAISLVIQKGAADQFDVLGPRFSGVSQSLQAVKNFNGIYFAVGAGGTILTSPDGVTWTPEISGTTNRLNGITYGTNGYVVVGDACTILHSADGVSWTPCASPVTNKLSAVVFGSYPAGRYVAVGSSGIVVTSTNAVNWTAVNTGAPYNFNGVDFTWLNTQFPQNIFVLVGDSGTIMTSPTGLAWTLRSSGTFYGLNSVAIYCENSSTYSMETVGQAGTVVTSSDGINWTVQASGTTSNLLAVGMDEETDKFSAPRFAAAGQGGAFVTANGSQPSNTSSNLNGLVFYNGNYLAVGDGGVVQAAISWLPRNPGTTQAVEGVTFAEGKFVAVGGIPGSLTNVIVMSTNGTVWTRVYAGTGGSLNTITYGGDGFVAAGTNGVILNSADGVNWNRQNVASSTIFQSSAYGNGVYLLLGYYLTLAVFPGETYVTYNPEYYRSTDGLNWTGPYTTNLNVLTVSGGITFGENMFVAVGTNGALAASADGLTWTNQVSDTTESLVGAVFGNGLFVAAGASSVATISANGSNWSAENSTAPNPVAIGYGDEGFVIPSYSYVGPRFAGGILSTSADGTNWTARGYNGNIGNIAFGNGTYVIAGGGITQSTLTNAQASPLLSGHLMNQGFQLSATAQPNFSYRIQSSTNFLNWSDVTTFTSTQAVTTYMDTTATNRPQTFYRISSP